MPPPDHISDNELTKLPGTQSLTLTGDLAAQMVAGIDRFLVAETEGARQRRHIRWARDTSSHAAYAASVEPNRQRLARVLGVVDPRVDVTMHLTATTDAAALIGECDAYEVFAVRWDVLPGIDAEGILIQPRSESRANVIALPDCDWTPEMFMGLAPGVPEEAQFARRLAESGCRVLIPALISRDDTYSGIPEVRMTNQPHREFLYRAGYELGRHIIGYEVQKVLAGVDWFCQQGPGLSIGVFGYGEGGLVAFYAGAVEPRIHAVGVSGYFRPREQLWREPIYRNVWSLLHEFGDAEVASLIAPRALTVEASQHPQISGPPPAVQGRTASAAPGVVQTPSPMAVRTEFERAQSLVSELSPEAPFHLIFSGDGTGLPGSSASLDVFLRSLGTQLSEGPAPLEVRSHLTDTSAFESRLQRQFDQILQHTQHLMHEAEFRRVDFWSQADASHVDQWQQSSEWYREYLWDEVIGRSPEATVPVNPRTRLVYDTLAFRGYEVVLDVYPDVFAYGTLLVPKGITDSEERPVVVCQHGLEGRPQDAADPDVDHDAYHQFACKLAERGFITYAPQNPYIGEDAFRVLVRKGHPIKQSLYSVIVRQHERTLEWLASLPFVDASRIAFYGLSYGGKTAMRIPAILPQYCLSICSADYNEWIWKNVSARHGYSYLITGEYDMYEFDIGNTFNYAELSWLICPRPFMVERGHHDGVAPDEWVAYEYAKSRRHYDLLGIGDRTEMEVFTGPHTIHGVGTFEFLHRHLDWPLPEPE